MEKLEKIENGSEEPAKMDVVNESNANSRAPSLSKTPNPITLVEDDDYEVVLRADLRLVRRRKQKPLPDKERMPKGWSPPDKEVSLAEAFATIDTSHLAEFLANPPEWKYPGMEVFELVDYLGIALSGVSSVECQFPWSNMNKLMDVIDLPFCHIPQAVYKTAADHFHKVEEVRLCTFIFWSFIWTRDRQAGRHSVPRSQLGVFIALSIILRSRPGLLPILLPILRKPSYGLEHSPQMIPFTVWMMAQVAQVNLSIAFLSWAHNLLPLVRNKIKFNPQSMDLILQLIEIVLSNPGAENIILRNAVRDEDEDWILFPITSFEILLPLTFPASYERGNDTERFEALYPSLKEVALADARARTEIEQVTKRILAFSLKFVAQGNAVLAKEATAIVIWCVTNNAQDTKRFEALYPLLKEVALADAAGRIKEIKQITQLIFDFSLKFSAQGNPVLAKEATAIAILCLTKNVDCCSHWDKVYMDNPKASFALLKTLVDEWKDHSLKLLSSRRDTLTLTQTMKSFRLKNKKGISEGGAKCSFYKEADKYSKEISKRLSSRGLGFLKAAAITAVVILVAVLLQWFYLSTCCARLSMITTALMN